MESFCIEETMQSNVKHRLEEFVHRAMGAVATRLASGYPSFEYSLIH